MVEQNPYQAPQADVGGVALSSGHYEFSALENDFIMKTATRTKVWGVISIVMGVLSAAGLGLLLLFWGDIEGAMATSGQTGVNTGVMAAAFAALIPLSLVYLVSGFFYIGSGSSLAAVVTTEGNDVELLMSGLDRLANAFRAEVAVTVLSVLIGVVMAIANAAAGAVS